MRFIKSMMTTDKGQVCGNFRVSGNVVSRNAPIRDSQGSDLGSAELPKGVNDLRLKGGWAFDIFLRSAGSTGERAILMRSKSSRTSRDVRSPFFFLSTRKVKATSLLRSFIRSIIPPFTETSALPISSTGKGIGVVRSRSAYETDVTLMLSKC